MVSTLFIFDESTISTGEEGETMLPVKLAVIDV
jgi:hypothetical protein